VKKPLRSGKKRLIKKHFKKHGVLPVVSVGRCGGLYWYKCLVPKGIILKIKETL
jgi:hypothetical protein